ncbi:citrate lyase holo-[acyl-carrier protein] synthase [Erwinia endophytica]|uniref:citrate lyase holo-[acyl-carrier protein] synthase n=1 Tax=Erwinia endophytica TaxID=1563158 RepID=UPI001265DF96|nr:citrate lyase holo-[acyl-carrier protein] synthase [Erwinia endophytica]KAB8312879.1 citrate lyase holo-[acyl-carrier protein] synthase [Erwinia endophytica]
MTLLASAGMAVSLDALLAAKDRRAAYQADWLARYQQPIISLTLVTPGAVKDSARYRNTMGVALQVGDQMLWRHRWKVLDRQVQWLSTGAEALWCVAHPAVEIKAQCAEIERTHPLGRLWDFDVFCPENGQVGRHSLDLNTRRCLVCDQLAHGCARSRCHPIEDVLARVDKLIDGWFVRD